ncbi:hypothetical protein DFS33DRAFT_1345569 [Desarmillaria ectypa]|nr:hypothetical protein DFS33DRAFT_1345569 [Desarmillaria ectypa]
MSNRCRRGCLKSPTTSPGLDVGHSRKCVAFCDAGSEEVHIADEWDRTPSEPARSRSSLCRSLLAPRTDFLPRDMLELKAIQRTLPRANQLPDMYTGKPASQFLSKVPIGLLPLLPTSEPPHTSSSSPAYTRQPSEERTSYFPPPAPPSNKAKKFAFLPLLETPPTSSHSPPSPTPNTNTGHAPSSNRNNASPGRNAAMKASKLEAVASPGLPQPSPLFLGSPHASSSRNAPAINNLLSSAKPIRRRNVMYINGQEIDLDEEEDEQPQTTAAEETIRPELVTCSFRSRRSRSISEASLKQEKSSPSLPIPIVAPIPISQKVPSPSSSPISLPPLKIHSSSPTQSRPSVRSPPTTNSFAPIKVVRATRDNTNPSNLVSLSSSWRRSPSPRTSPVLVPLA